MFKKLANLFKKEDVPEITFNHDVLGKLIFDTSDHEWQTDENPIYHGGIAGDEKSPDQKSIDFILSKLNNIEKYWKICSDDLQYIASTYKSIPADISLKELYRVAALSLYAGYWEVCFETYPKYKWLYIGMQFEGDELVSNTIDT